MNVDEIGMFLEHQGMSDEFIDQFFEHHGVKGQKWGVRRQKIHDFGQRHKTGLKIAGGAALLVGGAVVARQILHSRGNISVKNAVKITSPHIRPDKLKPFGGREGMSRDDADWVRKFMVGHDKRMTGTTAADKAYHILQKQHDDVRDSLKPGQFMRYSNNLKKYVVDQQFGWNPNTGMVGKSMIRELGMR